MPNLIDINVNQKGSDNTAPVVRQNKFIALLKAFLAPLVKLQNDIKNNYLAGATYAQYSGVAVYSYGDRVTLDILAGNASYEYINPTPSAGNYVTNTNYWYQLTKDNIGLTERLNFNAAKMQLEYILNRRFSPLTVTPPFGSAGGIIYILNNPSLPRIAWVGANNAPSSFVVTNNSNRRWWITNGTPDLTTTNYTIMIPLATLTGLRPTTLDAINMIKRECNRYSVAGTTFKVQHY